MAYYAANILDILIMYYKFNINHNCLIIKYNIDFNILIP
jgi:hypothetical protein